MAAITISSKSRYNIDDLKDKSEDQLLDWAKAKQDPRGKQRDVIGSSETNTLEDLSEVVPEDYEGKLNELTLQEQLKPMDVTKLFKFVTALRVSQGLEPAELHPLSAKKARAAPAVETWRSRRQGSPSGDTPDAITGATRTSC